MKERPICSCKPSRRWSWIASLVFLFCGSPALAAEHVFRLHLSKEPSNLDPQKVGTSVATYVLNNLYRNLFVYDNDRGLVPELGEGCKRPSSLVVECKLKKNIKWSDGQAITSADFIRSYKKLLDPQQQAPRADILFKVKDGLSYYQGKSKTFGITAPDSQTLRFELAEEDPDFEYDLASIHLSPARDDFGAYSGPYRLKIWKKGQLIRIEKNEMYLGGAADRPPVEFLFIEEDTVALQLYQKNEMQFLRRLPTLFIPSYREKKEFHWIPVVRFDYLGFGEPLSQNPKMREALAYGLKYPELRKIFSSRGTPGCNSLPPSWTDKEQCFKYDKARAQKAWAGVSKDLQAKTYPLLFSTLGGEDHKRATEWMQSQWKTLGPKIQPTVLDNKIYLSEVRKKAPPLFRKGIAIDRPTCLAALSTFSENHPENLIRLHDFKYQAILKQLAQAKDEVARKKICTEGIDFLMTGQLLIPLGAYDLAILAKPEFTGWKLNQMNQLDLSALRWSSDDSK